MPVLNPIPQEQTKPLAPASECEILDTWHTSGLRGADSHDYVVDGLFVPGRRAFLHPLMGAAVRPELHCAFPVNIAMMSAVALGAARGAVDSLLELLETKVDHRSGRPVAAAEALTGSARTYLYRALEELWAVVMAGEEPGRRLRAEYRLACTNAVSVRSGCGPLPQRRRYQRPVRSLGRGRLLPGRPRRGGPRLGSSGHPGGRGAAAPG